VDLLAECLPRRSVAMAPAVLAELLSDPLLPPAAEQQLVSILMLELTGGFWQRVGKLRAGLRKRGRRPKLADTLIAQTCLDHDVPLLTRDRDFRPFARHAGLRLL